MNGANIALGLVFVGGAVGIYFLTRPAPNFAPAKEPAKTVITGRERKYTESRSSVDKALSDVQRGLKTVQQAKETWNDIAEAIGW